MVGGVSSGSLRFGEGSPLVHRWITGSIQGVPWIASDSPWGAEEEHHRIIYLRKTIKNPLRRGCSVPYDVHIHHRLIHEEADHRELNYEVERSGVDRFDPGRGLGEPCELRGKPHLGPWGSEAIRFGC